MHGRNKPASAKIVPARPDNKDSAGQGQQLQRQAQSLLSMNGKHTGLQLRHTGLKATAKKVMAFSTFTFLRPSVTSIGCGLYFLTVGVKRGTGSIGSSMRSPVRDMGTETVRHQALSEFIRHPITCS